MYYSSEYSKVPYEREKVDLPVPKRKLKSIKNESSVANQCKICGLVNFNAWSLTIHMRRHNNERPAKCSYCNASFVNNTELKAHIATHTKEKRYKCRFCAKWFTNNSSKSVHEDTHGILEHKCKHCDEKFLSQAQRRIHQKTHKEALTCRFCIKKFASEEFLHAHEQSDHMKTLSCKRCNLTFLSLEEVQAHKIVHKTTRRVSMTKKCNEVDYYQDSDVKLSTYFFTCGICLKKFPFRLDLTKHIESVHQLDEKDNIYKFKCVECNKSFDSKIKLKGHMIGHGPKKHKCPHCDYGSTRGKDLARHIQARHSTGKNFKCSECGALFVHYSTFVCHKLKHGEKKFKCDMCDKAYYVKSRLSFHKRISHYSANPVCDQCGKVFRNIVTLRGHQRRLHNRHLSLCLCNHCGKTIYVNEVITHQKECSIENYKDITHKLKGPLCSLCNITFTVQRDLLEHYKELHPSGVHPCEFCHKEYLSLKAIEKHKEREHAPNKPLTRKHKFLFTIEEKRVLKKSEIVLPSDHFYECFACGQSFINELDMNEHTEQSICLQLKRTQSHKTNPNAEQYFSLTKVYESNGHAQVLNDYEVHIIPQTSISEPLNIITTLTPNFSDSKELKREPLNKKKLTKPWTASIQQLSHPKEENIPLLHSQSLFSNDDSACGLSADEPSETQTNQTLDSIPESKPKSIVSSKELLKLLENKTVDVDGMPFIPFNELFEHLKLISGIQMANK